MTARGFWVASSRCVCWGLRNPDGEVLKLDFSGLKVGIEITTFSEAEWKNFGPKSRYQNQVMNSCFGLFLISEMFLTGVRRIFHSYTNNPVTCRDRKCCHFHHR